MSFLSLERGTRFVGLICVLKGLISCPGLWLVSRSVLGQLPELFLLDDFPVAALGSQQPGQHSEAASAPPARQLLQKLSGSRISAEPGAGLARQRRWKGLGGFPGKGSAPGNGTQRDSREGPALQQSPARPRQGPTGAGPPIPAQGQKKKRKRFPGLGF